MQEWWTYSLSDFLLFSPRTYYRLLQRYNEALWPAQLLTLALGAGILALLRRPSARQGQIIAGILALLWIWMAWGFLWQRYATINWITSYVAPLFVLQALVLLWWGGVRGKLSFRASQSPAGMVGVVLAVVGLLLYPLLTRVSGRPWSQAEVFGIHPDPTVLGTLGLVLLTSARWSWTLLIVPILWCIFSGATLVAMHLQP
jgi:Family of unknown function (DUF6064)